MCGRYARKSAQELLAEWFEMELEQMRQAPPTWSAAPQSFQPVVRLNPETGRREMPLMRWGLAPSWILLANSIFFIFNGSKMISAPLTLCPQNGLST